MEAYGWQTLTNDMSWCHIRQGGAAEGSSPGTVERYRMILIRAVRRFGETRPINAIAAAELRITTASYTT
jgi:hypothetical protein